MTEDEIEISDKLRNNQTKSALGLLYRIYNKYNDIKVTDCWCARTIRVKKHKEYYEWFDKQDK